MSLLKDLKIKGRVLYEEPMCRHTTFGIGGPAKIWAEPEDIKDLRALLSFSKTEGLRSVMIGGGSNLLISDKPQGLMAISLKKAFNFVRCEKDGIVCGAGCDLQKVILLIWMSC